MNYNKFSKNIYVYLYISKNKQKYLCGGAGAGGWPYDYIVWQAANASREPRVLFYLILMQYKQSAIGRIFFCFLVFFVEQIIIFDSKKKKLFYLPVRLK